jgi:hypothetical protein
MDKTARTERIRRLSKLALNILHRNQPFYYGDLKGERVEIAHFDHNEFRFAHLRWIDREIITSRLEVHYFGAKVLLVEWDANRVLKTSYQAGTWERELSDYDRSPALAGGLQN